MAQSCCEQQLFHRIYVISAQIIMLYRPILLNCPRVINFYVLGATYDVIFFFVCFVLPLFDNSCFFALNALY